LGGARYRRAARQATSKPTIVPVIAAVMNVDWAGALRTKTAMLEMTSAENDAAK
jgi:hypothetical protein